VLDIGTLLQLSKIFSTFASLKLLKNKTGPIRAISISDNSSGLSRDLIKYLEKFGFFKFLGFFI
jgi:hypothetical protein